MSETIKVGMADLKICKAPDSLTTIGLGSCVGIALYDPITKVSGLAHIMLPDSTQIKNNTVIAKFADTGITKLLDDMIKAGARRPSIVAKIAGGARMFALKSPGSSSINIFKIHPDNYGNNNAYSPKYSKYNNKSKKENRKFYSLDN